MKLIEAQGKAKIVIKVTSNTNIAVSEQSRLKILEIIQLVG
jgi:hypothetical protein